MNLINQDSCMMNGVEKEFDDEVYEDEFYEENFDEEELVDEEEGLVKDFDDDDDDELVHELDDDDEWDSKATRRIETSYACEDCDYRWENVIVKRKTDIEEEIDDLDIICPMCGSMNISII